MAAVLKTLRNGSHQSDRKIEVPVKKQDDFCWLCHKKSPNTYCPGCIRSFHNVCISGEHNSNSPRIEGSIKKCDCCKQFENSIATSYYTTEELNGSLEYLIKNLLKDEDWPELTVAPDSNDKIVYRMDLKLMEEKIRARKYKTTAEYMLDVLWIQHNCLIVDGSKQKQKVTKDLISFCAVELSAIDACNECFIQSNKENNNDWFSMVCSRKHPIVWAKVKGHPYQPAKIMNVHHDQVDVFYFGDHKTATIPAKSCLCFSKKSPNHPLSSFHTRKIALAMKEVEKYIENIGVFVYSEFRVKFDPSSFVRRVVTNNVSMENRSNVAEK